MSDRQVKSESFPRVRESLRIKGVKFSNRIVFPPTHMKFCHEDGTVSEQLIRFHERIARGNVGLCMVGFTSISPEGHSSKYTNRIDDDRYIVGLAKLFKTIKAAGSVPGIQLAHCGRQTSTKFIGAEVVAPSPVPCPAFQEIPRELTLAEIETLEDRFAQGALRAKQAGAEVVEIHAAHGYLIGSFFSPVSNRRKDGYGGSLENRVRFLLNILAKTREKVGSDLVISCRINGDDHVEGGADASLMKEIAVLLEENGVDILSVSSGTYDTKVDHMELMKKGGYLDLAEGIKKVTHVPVIGVGKVLSLQQAEKALEEGKADLIGICRALLADPELVAKSLGGRLDEIEECTECGMCFQTVMAEDLRVDCAVNTDLAASWKA